MGKIVSDCKSNESHIEISILEGVIFLTEYSEHMSTVIYKTSVISFHSGVADLPEHFSSCMDLPSLECRRVNLKLDHLFKVVHGLCFFPTGIASLRQQTHHNCRSIHPLTFQ